MLRLIGGFTREALALRVERRLNSQDVLETLADSMIMRGTPSQIRSDNGTEFIAAALRRWIAPVGSKAADIGPGSPWENGYSKTSVEATSGPQHRTQGYKSCSQRTLCLHIVPIKGESASACCGTAVHLGNVG